MANGKYIAYYRVSSKKQGQSGLGLEAQQAAVLAYLNGGNWELVGEYTDVETGTRKGNHRPELAKALARCKREKATLVIAKLDRLARNVAFTSALMEAGVEFVAVDLPTANRLTIHILSAVAEHEAEMISARTKAALAAAKARGVVLGKPENLTTEAQAKGRQAQREAAVTAYANVARIVRDLRAEGESYQGVAERLNEMGMTTVSGSPFAAMTVKRIADRAS